MTEDVKFTDLEVYCKATECGIGDRLYCSTLIGDLQEAAERSSTSIGYGTKYDFTRDAKSKSPVFYNFKSDFDPKNPSGPSYTFGLGRDRMYKTNDYSGPGPAKYNYLRPFGKDGIKYTMRIKYNRSASMENLGYPGPGAYKPVTKINPEGTYIVSKNENIAEKIQLYSYSGKDYYYDELLF